MKDKDGEIMSKMFKRWRIRGSFSLLWEAGGGRGLLSGRIIRLWFSLGREDASERMNEQTMGAWLDGRGEEGERGKRAIGVRLPGPGPRLEHPHVRERTHTQYRASFKRTCAYVLWLFSPEKLSPLSSLPFSALLLSFSHVYLSRGHFLLFKI